MSVIFEAKGCIIYETRDALADVVTWLRETDQMNNSGQWLNGHRPSPNSDDRHVYPDWNGLEIPYSAGYRNLRTGRLLEDATWATVITLAGPSDETVVRNADHEITHRINMEEWFRENVVDEKPHLGWEHDYIHEVWEPIDVEPPAELKERMRVKNAARAANAVHDSR